MIIHKLSYNALFNLLLFCFIFFIFFFLSIFTVVYHYEHRYLILWLFFFSRTVLGLTYSFELDLWSLAVTLYELFTGRIMFAGHTNNQMLRLFMALKGQFPHRLIRNAMFRDRHFDAQFNFIYQETDKVTQKVPFSFVH